MKVCLPNVCPIEMSSVDTVTGIWAMAYPGPCSPFCFYWCISISSTSWTVPPGGSLVNKAVNKSLKCSGNAALSPAFTWLLFHQFTTACFVTGTDEANCNSRVACMCRETKKLEKGVPVRCRRRYAVGADVSGSQQHLINRTPRLCFSLKDFLFTASIYFLLLYYVQYVSALPWWWLILA